MAAFRRDSPLEATHFKDLNQYLRKNAQQPCKHARRCTCCESQNQLAASGRADEQPSHARNSALRCVCTRAHTRARSPDSPRGLATFTFTCNYLPLRACLPGSIIAERENDESFRCSSSKRANRDERMRPAGYNRQREIFPIVLC